VDGSIGIIGIETRWYAPLLRPVFASVSRALEQLGVDQDPWALPRTGLGGAMVLQVARGFGSRTHRQAEQLAVAAVEGYNHRLHLGEPTAEERARWLARDLRWAQRAWQSMIERDEPTLTRVIERLFGRRDEVCDRSIPEAVLFMRGAVATGVVLGEVPESIHAALDEYVTWLGLSWEAHAGMLDEAGWQGALAAIRLAAPFPAQPERVARERAVAALASLPASPALALFRGAVEHPPIELPSRFAVRSPSTSESARGLQRGWMPLVTPNLVTPTLVTPTPRARTSDSRSGALDRLVVRWSEPIEAALHELTKTGSDTLTQATQYLQGQGGKRVRPLLTLAAAEACGADPRRALPLAAAVEWLHQGTLVLDDIIDAATLRRGHVALHAATSDVFATGVAVFVFGRVLRASQGMHPDIRRHVVGTALALVEGERLELLHTGDTDLSLTRYYGIIEAKTARLFGCAAAVGALCAEPDSGSSGLRLLRRAEPGGKHVTALSRYGRELGLAFQIIDDLLDYEGDEATFGKRPGTDFRAAKLTLPLLLLREQLGASGLARLAAALGRDGDLAWVQAELREHGIAEACRDRAARHSARAVAALEALPISDARETLAALALELGARRC
jgi:octaprenyl-diphosphate synthase